MTTIIVGIYFIALLAIGWAGNRVANKSHAAGKTTWAEEFFTGAKSMSPLVLACTFAATFASGGTFMGHPGLGYSRGFTWSWAYMCAIWCGFLPFILLGKRMFRVGFKIKAVSPADVIEYRYENDRILGIGMILLTVFFYMAYITSQLAAGGKMLAFITGLDYVPALFIFAIIIVIYVTAAGMRGVAWTDTLQGILMLVVAMTIIPTILAYAGGMENITSNLAEINPSLLRGGSMDTATSFGAMISFMFVTHGFQGMGQPAAAQRLLIYDNPKAFKWGALLAGFMIMFMSTLMVLSGVLGRALFPDLASADNIVPTLIQTLYPTIIGAIFLSGILAAINSSANSYILCVSTAVVKDLILDHIKPDMKDETIGRLNKVVTFLAGALGLIFAIKPPDFIGLLVLYAWKGLGLGIGLPLIFGCMWKRATKQGAIASIIASMVVYIYVNGAYGSKLFGIGLDSGAWGLIAGIIAMVVVSLLTPPTKQDVLNTFFDEPQALNTAK